MIPKQDAIDNNIKIIDTNESLIDAKNERIAQIKALLPNVINSDNQLDIKALNDLLGAINTTSNNQGYELTFAGKGLARAKADEKTTKELKIEPLQSKNFDATDNVIIRGDNIDSLKILYKNYHNKIKMIYIDPPYNTKSENFVYNDNFKQSEADLIKSFGLNDDTCNFLNNVYGTRSHSGWLSFIYPRLMLAKELLTDDGVIFISIDDNEQANLKIICDEIFGEENFVSCISWRKSDNQANLGQIARVKEYIMLYSKNKQIVNLSKIPLTEKAKKEYSYKDENGFFRRAILLDKTRGRHFYDVKTKNGKTLNGPWMIKEVEFIEQDKQGRILWTNSGEEQPYGKIYLDESNGQIANDFWDTTYGSNQEASLSLEKIFNKRVFDFPKSLILLKNLMNIGSCHNNDLILDFFAGSGTTAHAVMQLNAEDGGNRKFILCQWDEKIDPKKSKPAYDFCIDNGFEPVISSITLERVNRAGNTIKEANPDKNIDIGYKVFSLTEKPRVNYDAEMQPSFHIINTRGNLLDTLVNMLVATCQTLDTKIETIRENAIYKANNEIYVVNKITANELENFKDLKINIDAFADINLTDYLNLDLNFRENMTVIY